LKEDQIHRNLILKKIRGTKQERDEAVKLLYFDQDIRSSVKRFVMNNGGQSQDVRPILHICIMKLVKTVIKNDRLVLRNSLVAYIVGIAKFSWYDELTKRGKVWEGEIPHVIDDHTPEKLYLNLERKHLLEKLMGIMRANCKEVLMLWANGYSMEEIANNMNYKSFKMAKKKKYECMKQLLEYIDQHPEIKEVIR